MSRQELAVPHLRHPADPPQADLGVRTVRLPMARLGTVAEETAGIRAADLRFEAAMPVSTAMGCHWPAFMDLTSCRLKSLWRQIRSLLRSWPTRPWSPQWGSAAGRCSTRSAATTTRPHG